MKDIIIICIAILIVGLVVVYFQKQLNKLKYNIEQLEVNSQFCLNYSKTNTKTRYFEIYQGNTITLTVKGVLAYGSTYDAPTTRFCWEKELVYIMSSTGKVFTCKGILIKSKEEGE
jgi:hypothetical protein